MIHITLTAPWGPNDAARQHFAQLDEKYRHHAAERLYGLLFFAVLAVFVAGLMVGRMPEFLGKQIEGREMKFAMLAVLALPLAILGFTAVSAMLPVAVTSIGTAGRMCRSSDPPRITEASTTSVFSARIGWTTYGKLTASYESTRLS